MQGFPTISSDLMRWLALIIVTAVISVGFFQMTQGLLVPLALAAITGAMVRPMTARLAHRLGGRETLAVVISLLALIAVVFVPMAGLLTVAVSQALSLIERIENLATSVTPREMALPLPDWVPFEGSFQDLYDRALTGAGALARSAASFFVSSLSSLTLGAAAFFLNVFVFFYALFFFLGMQTPIIDQILRLTSLPEGIQTRLNDRIVSVSRATIKGSFTIALIQGSLGGIAFLLAGIEGAAFWTIIMVVMAMLPAFGAPFAILCGAAFLGAEGQYIAAILLAVWAGAVSVIDNLLRPALVGRDAQLHDLIILVSTLGGLGMFGASGLILGPVLAGLFVTIWVTLAEAIAQSGAPEDTLDETTG